MRVLAIAMLLLPLAACAGSPQAFGITGPQGAAPESAAGPTSSGDPLDNPNTLQSGVRYGPSYTPNTNGGHFWGYD